MNNYIVSLHYSGFNTYFVAAENEEHARKLAHDLYLEGDNGDQTGVEEENVTEINAELIED